jgi:hypothetical protein
MMVWLGLGIAALVGFVVGAFLFARAFGQELRQELSRVGLNMASDRELALRTLRREIANYLVRLDPDRFLRLYKEARAADIAIGTADKASQQAELDAKTKKYPFYQDFDLTGARDHVLYADALSGYPLEEIEGHYMNMIKFHALQMVLDKDWCWRSPATSDKDLKHLEEYVGQIKDTKFRQRLMAAVEEFARRGGGGVSSGYETDVLAVRYVHHYAETRYGVHFKDTGEFGLYGIFYDDRKDKTYECYYRSDREFIAEIVLDNLYVENI